MAEFTDLGEYCAFCKRMDFLPFTCSFCQSIFCKEHRSIEEHQCLQYRQEDNRLIDKPKCKPSERCHFCQQTIANSLELVQCSHCEQKFGLCHRLPESHDCRTWKEQTQQALNKAIRTTHPPRLSVQAPKVKGTKNDALTRKVMFMKLKQTALGLKSTPSEERLYLNISASIPSQNANKHVINSSQECRYFFSREWSVGRSIDYLATELKIPNHNNRSDQDMLVLSAHPSSMSGSEDDFLHFAFDRHWKDLVNDQQVDNGSTIYLRYQSRK